MAPGGSRGVRVAFNAKLWRYPGKGGWHFVDVPRKYAPSATVGWGRSPVTAQVDGKEWKTSVWREKSGRTLLPVPRAVRRAKTVGDRVQVGLDFAV
ncbi:MAG: DUF1905 domain-containing protein [Gemmatimonadetes bacterium]|nr:DUF1905 domain-containing protein [Gemmatimonadota bacterium]